MKLALGSIVIYHDVPLMVVGYFGIRDSKMYDYILVKYPEGIVNNRHIYYLNEDDFESILTHGYENKDFEEYQKLFKNIISK